MIRLSSVIPALLCLIVDVQAGEEKVALRFEKLGAVVKRDKKLPGSPVISIILPSNIKDADLKDIGELKDLTYLQIGGAEGLTDEGLKELVGLKKLESLFLYRTPVTDAGLKHLSEMKELRELNLEMTRVNGSGLRHLANNNKKLTFLNLAHTPMTDDGLREMALNPGFQNLTTIYLLGCKSVTNEAVVNLKKSREKCMVFNADGGLVK
jgi:hypothetical protein